MNNYQDDIVSHSKVLYSFAYKLTKNKEDTQDLVQDTILKAILKESNFKKGTNLKAWLCKMMYRLFLDRINNTKNIYNKNRYSFEEIFAIVNYETAENLAFSNLSIEYINQLISELSYKPKECFILRSKGFKYNDIAQRLNMPLGSVKSNLAAAKKELKNKLNKQGYDKNSKT